MERQKLILVRGLPGSGKSTFAKQLALKEGLAHYEADRFFDERGRFDARLLPVAHARCLRQTHNELGYYGGSVVVSNTFTTLEEMEPYFQLAEALGAEVVVYKCRGRFKSIHNVPPATIRRMAARWQDIEGERILPVWEEGQPSGEVVL